MLSLIMLFWIGWTLSAPAWYWWFWGISVAIKLVSVGIDIFKAGKKSN